MAKRPQRTVRSYDDFEFGLKWSDGTTVKVFALKEGESIPNYLSTNYDHHWHGPALVYERVSPQGRQCDEYYVNDPGTWAWISSLVRDGIKSGATVISKCQEPLVGGE